MTKRKHASSIEELLDIINIDYDMIKSYPEIQRKQYIGLLFREIALSIERSEIISLENLSWDGSNIFTATVNFKNSNNQVLSVDLSDSGDSI